MVQNGIPTSSVVPNSQKDMPLLMRLRVLRNNPHWYFDDIIDVPVEQPHEAAGQVHEEDTIDDPAEQVQKTVSCRIELVNLGNQGGHQRDHAAIDSRRVKSEYSNEYCPEKLLQEACTEERSRERSHHLHEAEPESPGSYPRIKQ
ncbi:hypothetical protein QAD02_017870 [Eretmocerus hayati]|uniref:Uncharacterized protein n=1 Tax=Eretmocerus hayati TaxID=131215 RepID=A0ACC2PGB7_9HYME|nr:hypothetical protein QAD02_017870 [Eretmocerus hayati]